MRPCFAFSNTTAENGKVPVLSIYDEIGFWGVQSSQFRDELSAVAGDKIEVDINSPGGDYFAGLSMYHMLRASGKEVTTRVMGIAASAASVVFMAGDVRTMPKNTFLMIHSSSMGSGTNTAADHRATADVLDKIDVGMRGVYLDKIALPEAELQLLLSTDTFISADEALAAGFATEVTEDVAVSAKFDVAKSDFPAHVLAALLAKPVVNTPVDTKPAATAEVSAQIHAAVIEAGLDTFASQWAITCLSVEDAQTKITSARTVRALCGFAKVDDKADGFIKAGTSIADVRAALIATFVAEDEKTVVDTATNKSNTQVANSNAKPVVSPETAWASHNKGKGQSK